MQLFVQFFTKYLLSRRAGSVVRTMARLSWAATLIGVAALIVVMSIMNGFNASIHKKLMGLDPHVIVTVHEGVDISKVEDLIYEELPDAEAIERVSKQDVIIRSLDGAFAGAEARGYSKTGLVAAQERLFKNDLYKTAEELKPREILIGVALARQLNLFDGDEVLLMAPESLLLPKGELPRYERMYVKNQFITDMEDIDSKLLLFSEQETAMRFQSLKSRQNTLEIRLLNPPSAPSVKRRLEKALVQAGVAPNATGNARVDDDNAKKSITIETWFERNAAMFQALRLEKVAMSTFLGLAILITCFPMISIVTMLVSQKKKEIGLLMALGLPMKQVMRLFLSVGMLLSGLGLVSGLLLGAAVSLYIQHFPPAIMPDIYVDSVLPSRLDPWHIFWVAIFISVIAFFSAFLPVRSALVSSPAENLRGNRGT